MKKSNMSLKKIQERIRDFASERNWEQFHNPKNLAMAIGSETGELLEIFQWMTEDASKSPDDKTLDLIKEELSDIMIYCLRACDILKIDPIDSMNNKIDNNAAKYPVDKSFGNAVKYNRR